MSSRLRTRKKSIRKQTPELSTAPAQEMFQSRSFVVQSQTAEKSQQPDLKTALMRAQRYGHHLSQIHPTGSLAPKAVQPKLVMGQSVKSDQAKTPKVLQAKLSLGTPGDTYEQEADTVAAQVVDQIQESGERSLSQQSSQIQSTQRRKKKNSSQSLSLNIQPLVQQTAKHSVQPQWATSPYFQTQIVQRQLHSDLKTRLNRAARFGHNLSQQMLVHTSSSPIATVQTKASATRQRNQPVQRQEEPEEKPTQPKLNNSWQQIKPDVSYQSAEGRLVSFSKTQITLGRRYDSKGKHLRAINNGLVPPKGHTGLVPSELDDYDFKSKILGQGGDRRFHGKIIQDILHFPGKDTKH